ncbi:hypothetical protein TURU_059499 [Turdus rufiventris]|nr:hypothetical protein TURU_059499 [Turdus rufiventris]
MPGGVRYPITPPPLNATGSRPAQSLQLTECEPGVETLADLGCKTPGLRVMHCHKLLSPEYNRVVGAGHSWIPAKNAKYHPQPLWESAKALEGQPKEAEKKQNKEESLTENSMKT